MSWKLGYHQAGSTQYQICENSIKYGSGNLIFRGNDRVNRRGADRARDETVNADSRNSTFLVCNARAILDASARHILNDLRNSIQASNFQSGGFHQQEGGAEIALTRRADGEALHNYMCMERPITPRAASFTASDSVGCACTVIPMSSDDPRYSNACTTS